MPDSLAHTLEQLQTSKVRAYYDSPMPAPLDAEVTSLVREFAQGTVAQRRTIEAALSEDHSYGLLIFAERMAALAVREKSVERVNDGLWAIGAEHFRLDLREDLMVMSLLYHSAAKIGADPDSVFGDAAKRVPADVAEQLAAFVQRPREMKTITTMGYREVNDAGGFRYTRIGHP